MTKIVEDFLTLADKHANNTLACVSLCRATTDLEDLRLLRRAIAVFLSENTAGKHMTLEELQSEMHYRVDLIAACSVVDARIVELCAPDIRDPQEFAQLVSDIGEEADFDAGLGVYMPSLDLIFGEKNGSEK